MFLKFFLHVLTQITSKKYFIKITLVFLDDFQVDTIVLFDTSADLNCTKEGIVLKRFLHNISEKLYVANNTKLVIKNKTQVSISNNDFYLKNFFVVTNDINHIIILDTPFIDIITPYKTDHENITSKINGSKLVFPFLEKPKLEILI
jgi:aspartate carbamoyltransferase regulatory subunit